MQKLQQAWRDMSSRVSKMWAGVLHREQTREQRQEVFGAFGTPNGNKMRRRMKSVAKRGVFAS